MVLLGAPGVGKGTQAALLAAELGACPLSTGDVFRAAKSCDSCGQSAVMQAALGFMRRGELVPDTTVLEIVRERVACLRCPGGFLLDGFPRTVPQARALAWILETEKLRLDAVLSYELPIEEIVARAVGRRNCPKCRKVYHLTAFPPKVEGICDVCGTALVLREDDKPETVRVRMKAYEKCTAPLAKYYRRAHLLVPIAARGSPDEIFHATLEALRNRPPPVHHH